MLELLKLEFLFFFSWAVHPKKEKKYKDPKNTAQEVDAHFVWQRGNMRGGVAELPKRQNTSLVFTPSNSFHNILQLFN